VVENGENQQIIYKFKDQVDMELVNTQVADIAKSNGEQLLVITSDLEETTKAVLLDSFKIYKHGHVDSRTMRVHRRLAPVKTAVGWNPSCTDDRKQELTNELHALLREMQVTCQRHRAVSDQLAGELDETGVYLIVTCTDETFENGFLQVRNRDNTLQSPVHISELQKYIYRHFR